MAWTQIVDCRISGNALRFDLVPESSGELVIRAHPMHSVILRSNGKPYGSGRPLETSYLHVKHSRFEPVIEFVEKVLAAQPEGAVEEIYTYWCPAVSVQLNAELTHAQLAGLARIGSGLGITMHAKD